MANRNKAKGTSFETAVADFMRSVFPMAERRALAGSLDKGDLAGIYNERGSWVIECKNTQRLDLAGFVDEAKKEKTNAKANFYAAVIKRRGKNVAQSYVVMELEQFLELIKVPRLGEGL